jgi:hypothetical protein
MDHDVTLIINEVIETIIVNIECKKTVTFNENYNTNFIIQSIDDNDYYHDKSAIWWSSIDYSNIYLLYKDELFHFIQNYKKNSDVNLSVKDAIRLLNQP